MLRFMGLQRVGHDGVTELNLTDSHLKSCHIGIIINSTVPMTVLMIKGSISWSSHTVTN